MQLIVKSTSAMTSSPLLFLQYDLAVRLFYWNIRVPVSWVHNMKHLKLGVKCVLLANVEQGGTEKKEKIPNYS